MVNDLKLNIIKPHVFVPTVNDGIAELLKCASAARVSRGKCVTYDFYGDRIGYNSCKMDDMEPYQKGIDLIDRLLHKQPAHESVLEHGNIRIDFRISRVATHQLVRHRNCAFTQESTRYVVTGKSNEVTIIKPMGMPDSDLGQYGPHDTLPLWSASLCFAVITFKNSMKEKTMTNEDARYMLPGCLASNISVTANIRQWRTMVKIRTHKTASPEMIYIFEQVKDYLGSVSPSLLIGLNNG